MPHRDLGQGATPGVTPPPLTREPLGTRGELTPGPDHLDPDVPEDRRELERLGYPVALEDLAVEPPEELNLSTGRVLPELPPLLGGL